MKERQILFSGPMVAAILSGRKSQTRRFVKLAEFGRSDTPGYDWHYRTRRGLWSDIRCEGAPVQLCPYGRPGDRLWVRETWRAHKAFDLVAPSKLPKINGLHYEADGPLPKFWDAGKRRPSIHIPRWASRITLEITGVRCERLLQISADDAKAEGLGCVTKDGSLYKYGIPDLDGLPGNDNHGWHWKEWERDPRNAYHKLWEQINGPGSAVADPWVWVVEFKRVTP